MIDFRKEAKLLVEYYDLEERLNKRIHSKQFNNLDENEKKHILILQKINKDNIEKQEKIFNIKR